MGDYLSELATKNIETAEVIQPRRAARFEPLQPSEAQVEPLLFQPERFDLERSFEDMRSETHLDSRSRRTRLSRKDESIIVGEDSAGQIPQTQFVSPVQTRPPKTRQMAERVSIQSKMNEEERAATNNVISSPRLASLAIFTPPKSLSTSGDADEKAKTTVEQSPAQPHFEPKTIERKISETKRSEPQVVKRKLVETQTSVVAKPRVSKAASRFEDAPVNETKILSSREQISKQIAENHFGEMTANQTKILPAHEKMPKQIAESAQTPSVPVINVTIGRVEIRAVASNPPPVKDTRPKPPALSLDEYLRQRRNGGER